MTAWEEYLAAAAQLDAVRRDEAAAVSARQDAVSAAANEISALRRRIAAQRSGLDGVAVRLSLPAPVLDPTMLDRTAATSILEPADSSETADPTAGVTAALRGATATLDAADATLFSATHRRSSDGLLPTWPPLVRNGAVYFWFAALSLVAVAQISHIAGSARSAGILVATFSVLVPGCAWIVAWLSVGLLFGADADDRRPRSSLLGLALCLIPTLVGFLLASR